MRNSFRRTVQSAQDTSNPTVRWDELRTPHPEPAVEILKRTVYQTKTMGERVQPAARPAGEEKPEYPEELCRDLKPEPENPATADIFKDLELSQSNQSVKPLFEGQWE